MDDILPRGESCMLAERSPEMGVGYAETLREFLDVHGFRMVVIEMRFCGEYRTLDTSGLGALTFWSGAAGQHGHRCG